MNKKIFFAFALFVAIFMSIAWQFAVVELAEIQSETEISLKEKQRQSKEPISTYL